ncbi:MAG TPA: Panacea domain-containing protein [Microvirga sp.]|nr:Panacea domain-containing protein [Microvirga sp.]
MATEGHDPRAVANLMLEAAEEREIALTNLALQKLLYFAHALFLVEKKKPLLSGYFEAWQYGPVHPVAYRAFKEAGDKPIKFRANRTDVVTGQPRPIEPLSESTVRRHIARIVSSYGELTPGRLVEISHAKNAPWDFIVHKGRTSVAFGMRIPDRRSAAKRTYTT